MLRKKQLGCKRPSDCKGGKKEEKTRDLERGGGKNNSIGARVAFYTKRGEGLLEKGSSFFVGFISSRENCSELLA